MLKFPPRNPELGLLFLKWVTRKSKHLEGQIYPAVSNIWNLAWQHGNLFVCRLLWVAVLSPFASCLLCIPYRWSSVNFWVLRSSWLVGITAFTLFWPRCQAFLNLTQIKLSDYWLDSWHSVLSFSSCHFFAFHGDVGDLLSCLWNVIDHAIKWPLSVCQKSNSGKVPAASFL